MELASTSVRLSCHDSRYLLIYAVASRMLDPYATASSPWTGTTHTSILFS
jgi:hypothetical protein